MSQNPNGTGNSFKMKKVYTLRKVISAMKPKDKTQEEKIDKSKAQEQSINPQTPLDLNNSQTLENQSIFNKQQPISQESQNQRQVSTQRLVDGPELTVDTLSLSFEQKLGCIQSKEVKVKNIGSSAIFYEWQFKDDPKINNNAIKDAHPKFFCHYAKKSIKPGEEITFYFSFLSEIPGIFLEECSLICEPQIATPIPPIRLQGKAYIDDQWKKERQSFLKELEDSVNLCSVGELVDDVVDDVRLPEPERPDVKDQKVAEKLFQQRNYNERLFFNPIVHQWLCELFEEVWQSVNPQSELSEAYWDQSIASLRALIFGSDIEEVQKICFLERLEHYTYLSTFPLPNKSQIYQKVQEFLYDASYKLGGDLADSVRKELDMWEIPFREPSEEDTEEDLKARKQEIQKIKAEWIKRTKKKKWGEEEDKQMVEEFRSKLAAKTAQELLQKFEGFDDNAEYLKVEKKLQQDTFEPEKYFQFLERCKTVKEYSVEGKKVLIKFNLKLQQNCEARLQQLEEYLVKKEEERKKQEEEKKIMETKKKKTVKKKGQKQEEEQKPLTFDFTTLLDQENWNGFLQTLRNVQEKSPFLILIGCTYRDRIGRSEQKLSVRFLLEVLKAVEPSIEFMEHSQLFDIREQLENEAISEGSIYLLQNLNFLPSQTLVAEELQDFEEDGEQKQKIIKRNVIFPEVRSNLDLWASELDLIIDEDKHLDKTSGISNYSHKEVILGTEWWRYVGLICRVPSSSVILSGDFSPQSFLLVCRLLKYCRRVYLGGKIAVKFSIVKNQLKQKRFADISLSDNEYRIIEHVLANNSQKLWIPNEFTLLKTSKQQPKEAEQEQENSEDKKQSEPIYELTMHALQSQEAPQGQGEVQNAQQQQRAADQQIQSKDSPNSVFNSAEYRVVDVSRAELCFELENVSPGQFYVVGKTTIDPGYTELIKSAHSDSTSQLLKTIYKLQENKRSRHQTEVNTQSGINYEKDYVFYLIGIEQEFVESIELKEKKVRIQQSVEGDEDLGEEAEEEEQEPEDEGEERKKIDLVADFRLGSEAIVRKLFSGEFDHGIKNISKYPKPIVL